MKALLLANVSAFFAVLTLWIAMHLPIDSRDLASLDRIVIVAIAFWLAACVATITAEPE